MVTVGNASRIVGILRPYGTAGLHLKLLARKLQRQEEDVARTFSQLSERGIVERIGDVIRLKNRPDRG